MVDSIVALRAPRQAVALALILLSGFAAPQSAAARNMEPLQLLVGGGFGPGLSMGSKLGIQPADFVIAPQLEFTFGRALSAVGGATLGLGGTMPQLGHLGVRLRAHDLGLALSPYVQVEFAGGGLLRVLNTRLRWVGARVGIGVEYFATRRVHFGVGLGLALGSTLRMRPAFYGLLDGLMTLSFALNTPQGSEGAAVNPN